MTWWDKYCWKVIFTSIPILCIALPLIAYYELKGN